MKDLRDVFGYRRHEFIEQTCHIGINDACAPPSFTALVPGMDAPLIAVDLPDTLKGKARWRVAERQLTDMLGSDAEQFVFRPFIWKKGVTDWSAALVVHKQKLDSWTRQIEQMEGVCQAIVPDYFALPAVEGLWVLSHLDGFISARLGERDGFAAEADLAMIQLRRKLDNERPRAVLWSGRPDAGVNDWLDVQGIAVYSAPSDLPSDLQPPDRIFVTPEINLLQDSVTTIHELQQQFRPFLASFAIFIAASVIWWGAAFIETRRIQDVAESIYQQNIEIARQNFIPTGPILDLRRQVSNAVSQARQTADTARNEMLPLELFQNASRVLHDHQVTVQTVSTEANGSLIVTLTATDFRMLDQLNAALTEARISVETMRSATQGEARVTSTLRLRPQT